jgi:hypothetical protein
VPLTLALSPARGGEGNIYRSTVRGCCPDSADAEFAAEVIKIEARCGYFGVRMVSTIATTGGKLD